MTLMTLTHMMTAIAVGVSLHSMMEPMNIRMKVRKLDAKLKNQPFEEKAPPITITAAWQSLAIGSIFTLVLAAISYLVLWFLQPSVMSSVIGVSVLLFVKEAINTLQVNSYHEEIDAVFDSVSK